MVTNITKDSVDFVKPKESPQIEGHRLMKFINRINGQPSSYINKLNYVFGKTLGAGSFGVVRQARNISTGEDVAVKILLKKAFKGNNNQLQMLYDELLILQTLDHPNIVKFKDWVESKDKFYIMMQLATGGELFDRICSKGKFTEEDASNVIFQVLGAVEYLHSNNIVHRDLKPENLLYLDDSEDSKLVISDFGISKKLDSDTDLIYKAAGSMGYVAPEVLTKSGHGKPCDVWSIGVITYTLLCGYSPFISDTVEGFWDECTSGTYPVTFHTPYWNNISSGAKEFIICALTIDPCRRPTAADLLNHEWITSNSQTQDLLPTISKRFNARKKFSEAVEIVKLNNRIQKLRQLYIQECDSDTDIEENAPTIDSINSALEKSSIGQNNPTNQGNLKSMFAQNTFAQIVRAVTENREKVLDYRESTDYDKLPE